MTTRSLATLAALAILTTGCPKKPASPGEDVQPTLTPRAEVAVPAALPDAVREMAANFEKLHFAYDSATLDPASRAALASNVAIMQRHGSIVVEVQGHADERGTVEYNLGLGERRAAAVRTYMVSMGVEPSRIRTVTYGEERPLVHAGGEVAWSQNRRAEFRVVSGAPELVRGTVN